MPVVLQLQAAVHVPTGLLQPAVDLPQALEAFGRRSRGESQGQRLDRTENRTDLLDLSGIESPDAEASPLAGLQHPFAHQPEKGFTDGGTADAELGGKLDVADT